MVGPALYDFAEAALGENSEMKWSLSEEVLRRQMLPIFEQCNDRKLTSEQALSCAMKFLDVKRDHSRRIMKRLFERLEEEERTEEGPLPGVLKIQEFLMGLDPETTWAMDQKITEDELRGVFEQCAVGELHPDQGVDIFTGLLMSKKNMLLEMLQNLCRELSRESQARTSNRCVRNGD